MKSMSISPPGRARLNCGCRWRNGLLKIDSPPIHILDGEKVCIQRIKPAQLGALLASMQRARISSDLVSVGFQTNLGGSRCDRLSSSTIFCEFAATWFKVSRPYRCWLPVIYQISGVCRSFIFSGIPSAEWGFSAIPGEKTEGHQLSNPFPNVNGTVAFSVQRSAFSGGR